jgi:hypothetical protein
MDDLIGGLVLTLVKLVLAVIAGAALALAWLIYKAGELLFPPLLECLARGYRLALAGLWRHWRRCNWRRRSRRLRHKALREIEAVRREQVGQCRTLVATVVHLHDPTAHGTTAVRSAVRSAVGSHGETYHI